MIRGRLRSACAPKSRRDRRIAHGRGPCYDPPALAATASLPDDSRCARRAARLLASLLCGLGLAGCATVRVTDPPRTADEQFLQSVAVTRAIADLSFVSLRDKRVFVDSQYVYSQFFPSDEQIFLVGELRNRLLIEGAALTEERDKAEVIVEVRSGAVGVNRSDFLLGFPGVNIPVGTVDAGSIDVPVIIPELAILKRRRQSGYASVSITAFFADTGELVASSGPSIARTQRVDYWFFGLGPRTTGDIPPAED